MSTQIEIPNKSLFKLAEVCELTGVKPYVLRFWESEFNEISPLSSATGQKMYEHKDIDAILKIKKLLFNENLTVEKAKLKLEQGTEEEIEETTQAPGEQTYRKLTERDLQKIILAKAKLASLVAHIHSIKKSQNWG